MNAAKDMLLSFAGSVARRCIDAVVDAELDGGKLTDTVVVEGATFSVEVVYTRAQEYVSIAGRMMANSDQVAEIPAFLRTLGFSNIDPEGSFEFGVPSSWVPNGSFADD